MRSRVGALGAAHTLTGRETGRHFSSYVDDFVYLAIVVAVLGSWLGARLPELGVPDEGCRPAGLTAFLFSLAFSLSLVLGAEFSIAAA